MLGSMLTRLASLLLLSMALVSAADRILVHGHRGARAARPENTISAFEYAIDAGADVLELDLAVTKDNVPVVSHFPGIATPRSKNVFPGERICEGPGEGGLIRTMTLQQVKQYDCGSNKLAQFPHQQTVPGAKIPTWEEVLDLAPRGKFDFNVETKIFPNHPEMTPSPEEFVMLLLEPVRKRRLESRIILQSFDFRTLRAMAAMAPKIRRSALFGAPKYDALMGIADPDKGFVSLGRKAQANILSPDISLVTPEEVKAAHAAGLQVVPYTLNAEVEWKKAADAKVDGIITDDPAALLAWLKKQHLH